MADAVEIRITASNGASQVFRAIQGDADKLGQALTKAGQSGDKAFDQVEKGAKEAERSVRSMGDRVQGAADTIDGMAVGLTALGATLVYAGRSAMEQERQIIALTNAWDDAAGEMLAFAEEMDAVTIFSDDDIRAGERFFVTLRENYGLTIEEIQRLMQTTADLASASGVSFEDASSRVVAAIRGEAEAAEYLGLTMNQQAIDRENLTLTMTNEEAARYRLNALYEQAATYEGTAQQVAQSSIGTYAELTDKLQDTAQAAGAIIGPWGSVVSGLGLGLAGVTSLVGGLGRMVGAIRNSTVAMSALGVATSPLALGLTALTVAGVAWFQTLDEGESAFDRFESAMDDLVDTDGQNFFENIGGAVKTFAVGVEEATVETAGLTEQLKELQGVALATKNQNLAIFEDQARGAANYADRAAEGSQVIQDGLTAEQVARQQAGEDAEKYNEILKAINEEYSLAQNESAPYLEAQEKIGAALQDQSIDADRLLKDTTDLYNLLTTGVITYDNYALAIEGVADNLDYYKTSNAEAIESTGQFTASLTGVASGAEALLSVFGDLATGIPTLSEQIESMAEDTDKLTVSVTEGADALASAFGGPTPYLNDAATQIAEITDNAGSAAEKLTGMGERGAESASEMADAIAETNAALRELAGSGAEGFDALIDAAKEAERAFIADALAVGHLDDALSQINLTSLATDSSRFAEAIGTAGDALDNTFRIIVGNTNALASQVEQVDKWALELINVQGEYGKIDDLLASGAITLQTYNEAQQAQIEISAANAQVQEDILAIQAQQAPLIADLTAQQAAYVDELSRQPEQQQLIALGWMDANTAAQANQAIMLASAAAAGEYGEAGYAMTQQMIQGAVAANPVLGEMLEQMGVISIGADGTITVNFDSVEGAKSEIEMLTDSIIRLTDLLDDGEINGSVNIDTGDAQSGLEAVGTVAGNLDGRDVSLRVLADNTNAQTNITATAIARDNLDGTNATVYALGDAAGAVGAVTAAATALAGIDGDTATVYINAIDNAGGVIGSVANQLFSLNGASATVTTYHQDVYNSVRPYALGGTVWADQEPVSRWGGLAAANGRTVMVGEAGPELVTLPHGAQVMPHAASMSRMETAAPPGDVTYHIPVTVQGNVYGIDDLAGALEGAIRQRRRGYGVART